MKRFIPLTLIPLLLFGLPAHAAISFDAVTNAGSTGSGNTLSFTHTIGAGCTDPILIVGAAGGSTFTNDITGVTDNSVACTLVGDVDIPGDRFIYQFYCTAPSTGSNAVVITSSDSNSFIGGASASYCGVAQTSPFDASTTNSHSGTGNLTTTLITNVNNDWTMLIGEFSGGFVGAGSGSTLRTTSNNPQEFDSNAPITPAGNTSMTITATGSSASVMAAFKPFVAATTAVTTPPIIFSGSF